MTLNARSVLWAVAVADLFIFGGWISVQEWGLHRGMEVKLPAEVYDPRDLLSGHYVRFRLTAEREAWNLHPGTDARSFCLESHGDRWHVSRARYPGDTCTPFIAGTVTDYRVELGVERFYVDERRASQVGWVPSGADTYLLANVDNSGAIHPIDLVVAGKSVKDGSSRP
jgi:uncharacterized membrane-anchored protein